jgi:hypothetical protein
MSGAFKTCLALGLLIPSVYSIVSLIVPRRRIDKLLTLYGSSEQRAMAEAQRLVKLINQHSPQLRFSVSKSVEIPFNAHSIKLMYGKIGVLRASVVTGLISWSFRVSLYTVVEGDERNWMRRRCEVFTEFCRTDKISAFELRVNGLKEMLGTHLGRAHLGSTCCNAGKQSSH